MLLKAPLVLALFLAAGLAGCTGSDQPDGGGSVDGGVDSDAFSLQAGKGAIEGLLVDDRFRPIDLEDEPQTEFQTTGFILLQETGQQVQTDSNGQFAFVDLEPGSYTLRVTAGGHETTPMTAVVADGEFTEVNILSRRVASTTNTILTQEYVVFVGCSIAALLPVTINDCGADLSGDSDRSSFDTDYTGFPDATALVIEMAANKVANYEVDVWYVPDDLVEDSLWYASSIFEDSYEKMVLRKGETNEEHQDYTLNDPWNNQHAFQTDFYIFGELSQEGASASDNFLVGGVGVNLGTKAQFLHSLFIGEPEVDLDAYCVLC